MRGPSQTIDCVDTLGGDDESVLFDTAWSPTNFELFASSCISGRISLFSAFKETRLIFQMKNHQDSCRSIDFTTDGKGIYSVSKDKSLQMTHIEKQKMVLRKQGAHSDPINKVKALDENLIATGDDAGCVKIWDIRSKKMAQRYKEHSDFISDFCWVGDKHTLLTTSGDGLLSIYDIRKKKPVAISANQDDELLSVSIARNGSKAIVGTQTGVILLFSWNDWGDCTDRFPGHPLGVSSLAKAGNNTLYTGSGDGIIRVIGILPNTLLGTIGGNEDESPIESMKLSHDGKWLSTVSHDSTIKIWDANLQGINSRAFSEDGDQEEDDDDEKAEKRNRMSDDSDDQDSSEDERSRRRSSKKSKKDFAVKKTESFFADLD